MRGKTRRRSEMRRGIWRRGKMRRSSETRTRRRQWQGGEVGNDRGARRGEEGAKPHREGETTGQSWVGLCLVFNLLYPIPCKIATHPRSDAFLGEYI